MSDSAHLDHTDTDDTDDIDDIDDTEGTYRFRWTTSVDIVVTATGVDEDAAYEEAARRAQERLDQVSSTINDVAIHGDIDGMSADSVEKVGSPA